jgi:hypothetical protein
MTQAQTSIATLAAALIGRTVTATDKAGATSTYTIAKLSDKLGTMKNGEKAEYVILQSSADAAVVMSLHPEAAKRLMTKGSDAGLVMADGTPAAEASTETVAEPAAPVAKVKKAKAPKAAKVKAEKPAKVAKVKKAKEAKPAPAAKEPSKKDLFMAVYTPNAAAGKTRQEIKTAAESLGLSLAGFNTYYQNAKSGKWA